jgi:multidrug resistance efflux pump
MHPNPRRVVPVILLVAAAAAGYWYFFVREAPAAEGALTATGSIEAVTIRISPEMGGRVLVVGAVEGEAVTAGQELVVFDPSLLAAQTVQAQANLSALQANQDAAEAAVLAALANRDLLEAGPSPEQLAVAETVVDRARLAAEAAEEAYDALPEAARDTPDGQALEAQRDQARASLANAEAQYDLAAAGARPEQLAAAQAQVDAAMAQARALEGQVEAATAALDALQVQIDKLTLTAPADGVVLSRAIEPGEVAGAGAVLLELGQLDRLSITVYVAEDRYGTLRLGQPAEVRVDSYPGQAFPASVQHIADQAEFTPRNVQTADGRKTTVFAVRLAVPNPDGRLKPGMPADVSFGE